MLGDGMYPESCSIRAVCVSFDGKDVSVQTPRKSSYKMPNNDRVVPVERNASHCFSARRAKLKSHGNSFHLCSVVLG